MATGGWRNPTARSSPTNGGAPGAITWQDVQAADVNGDGWTDLVGRTADGDWWVAKSDGTKFTNEWWGHWAMTWQDVQVADVNGDGLSDLVGRTATGDWWVARSDGAQFVSERWGFWSPITWQDVQAADVNGDGRSDLVGRASSGAWWVARSDGTQFVNEYWGYWSPITWQDVQVADLNGDGQSDLVGRAASGDWWVARSDGTKLVNERWGYWSPLTWHDVRVADVNGDGRSDLAGRTDSGDWWVGRSAGTTFMNELWGASAPVAWHDVQLRHVNKAPALLVAADGEAAVVSANASLQPAQLAPIVQAALTSWTTSSTRPEILGRLNTSPVGDRRPFRCDAGTSRRGHDLPGLAERGGPDGWFLDPTPSQDEEFSGVESARACTPSIRRRRGIDQLDLLTVVEHKLGHLAGLSDLGGSSDQLMEGRLRAVSAAWSRERRSPPFTPNWRPTGNSPHGATGERPDVIDPWDGIAFRPEDFQHRRRWDRGKPFPVARLAPAIPGPEQRVQQPVEQFLRPAAPRIREQAAAG